MLGFLNENHKAACRLLDSPRTSITGVAAAGGYGDPLRRKPGKSLAVGRWFNFRELGCHLGNVGLTLARLSLRHSRSAGMKWREMARIPQERMAD
jgi:hypothetical protein